MNPAIIDALADQHIRDLRQQAGDRQARPRRTRRDNGSSRRQEQRSRLGMRSNLGFAMVEMGYYLLRTAQLAPRD